MHLFGVEGCSELQAPYKPASSELTMSLLGHPAKAVVVDSLGNWGKDRLVHHRSTGSLAAIAAVAGVAGVADHADQDPCSLLQSCSSHHRLSRVKSATSYHTISKV